MFKENVGEIKAKVFPNFPLLKLKNIYKADEKEVKRTLMCDMGCAQNCFPKATGPVLVSYTCPQKRAKGSQKWREVRVPE